MRQELELESSLMLPVGHKSQRMDPQAIDASKSSSSSVTGLQSLIAGGIAGTVVDIALFPLDTIKTRLQSKQGFYASGGFSKIYSGLTSAAVGSAPGGTFIDGDAQLWMTFVSFRLCPVAFIAALFFLTFEKLKQPLSQLIGRDISSPVVHLNAAALGEMVACVVRVPTELIKQRLQTKIQPTVMSAVKSIYQQEGILGLYRGYAMTVFREIPFSAIQFPLYEYLKQRLRQHKKRNINALEAAVCGSAAGAVAAALTTPLDVVKTRIMLSTKSGQQIGISSMFKSIITKEGPRVLLSGIVPRVTWISIGGAVFLGTYELALSLFKRKKD